MGFVNLKEMAKRAKKTEEEIMELVELGVIKPQKSYCHPSRFGDGKEIAFYPEEALSDIEAAKAKPKPEPEMPVVTTSEEEVELEEPEEEEQEEEKAEPEPEAPKGKGKKKDKK